MGNTLCRAPTPHDDNSIDNNNDDNEDEENSNNENYKDKCIAQV